jgi:hypothetical protein
MTARPALRSGRWLKWVSGLLLLAAGCAEPPATAQVPAVALPVPPGQARLWFYRPWEPSESLNLADIVVNGSYFASIENGGAFYRDVPPGHYHIAPQSYGYDFNQDKDVDLVRGNRSIAKSRRCAVGKRAATSGSSIATRFMFG